MRWLFALLFVASCSRCRDDAKPAAHQGSAAPTRRNWSRPRIPPALTGAWSTAETTNSAQSWSAVADAYARDRARCTTDCLDAAYAVVLTRKNAVSANPPLQPPKLEDTAPGAAPLPDRVKALVAALDDYVKLAPATDPDIIEMKFLAANALFRWNQSDSIARLEELLREHRDDPAAEYAANMLLDALMRANRIEELKAWVADLLADTAFLSSKDALRLTLQQLQSRFTK